MASKSVYKDEIGRVLRRDGVVGGRTDKMQTVVMVLLALNIVVRTAFWILEQEG